MHDKSSATPSCYVSAITLLNLALVLLVVLQYFVWQQQSPIASQAVVQHHVDTYKSLSSYGALKGSVNPFTEQNRLLFKGKQQIVQRGHFDTMRTYDSLLWFREDVGFHTLIEIDRILYHNRSVWQDIMIGKVNGGGLFLASDGEIQIYEEDEQSYHEYISITPIMFHPNPENVLVIGGGDGLVLYQIIKDPRVKRAILVDIDEAICKASMEHLRSISKGSWDDPRVQVIYDDAAKFLQQTNLKFDVIIVDLLDPYKEFINLWQTVLQWSKKRMNPGAILSTHSDADKPTYFCLKIYMLCEGIFKHVAYHKHTIPSFGDWAFVMASDNVDLLHYSNPNALVERFDRLNKIHPAESFKYALGEPKIKYIVPQRYPAAFIMEPADIAILNELRATFDINNSADTKYNPAITLLRNKQ